MLGKRFTELAFGCLAAVSLAGCGSSDLGKVSGKVTLDGQPLSDAILFFSPTAGGSPSAARTDGDGRFSLVYSQEERGALPGQHEVWISTALPSVIDGDAPQPALAERVPPAYRAPGSLKAEVKAGSNTINFELLSSTTAQVLR